MSGSIRHQYDIFNAVDLKYQGKLVNQVLQQFHILAKALLFLGEALQKTICHGGKVGMVVKFYAPNMAMLVVLGILLKKDKVVGGAKSFVDVPCFSTRAQAPDIVNAGTESKATPAEVVAPTARSIVSFQHQNLLACTRQGKS